MTRPRRHRPREPRVTGRPWVRVVAGVAWIATLVGTVVLLHRLGQGTLSAPPVLDRAELRRWSDGRDAVVAAFALVRLVGLALDGYLLLVTVLGLAARLSRVPALVAAVDVATIPAVRRALGSLAGVSLTASAASVAAVDVLPPVPAVSQVVPGAEAPVALQRVPDRPDVILRRVPPGGVTPVSGGRATMQVDPDAPTPERPEGTATMRVDDGTDAPPDRGPAGWTVRPGDHLWHVAETTLARAWGRPPTDAEVAPYWTAVVEANRSRLIDPANPDLIRPGQVLSLPLPPSSA